MASTIIDQIVDNLKTQLATITIANGYETTVESIYEPATILGYKKPPAKSYQIQLVLDDPERNEDIDIQGNPPRIGWNQPIQMMLLYRPSDAASTPIRTVLNKFWADAIKATMADPYRSNLAIDTTVSDPGWFINDQDGFVGIDCTVNIKYRHKENNPYEQ